MARIRQLKPEFWTDDKVAGLSRDARLLFLGLLTEADDDGRLVDSPKLLAGSIFPFDDDVTPKKLTTWLEEIMRLGLVRKYVRGAASYLYVVNFKRHQRIAHPRRSSLPDPDDDPQHAGGMHEDFTKNAPGPPKDSGDPPAERAPDLGIKGSRDQGIKGVGVSVPSSSETQSRGSADLDDDDEEPERQTLDLLTERRMALTERNGSQVSNPVAYRARVAASVEAEIGFRARDLLADGLSPGEVVEELLPLPKRRSSAEPDSEPSPYAEAPPLEYVELDDGSVVLGGSR